MEFQQRKILRLMEQENWTSFQIAAQLLKGLNYPRLLLDKYLEGITQLYLKEYMPEMDYHRFGCSLIDRLTFELIYKKLNEFLIVPGMRVEVCSEYMSLKPWVKLGPNCFHESNIYLEDLSSSLYYSIKARFEIGEIPPSEFSQIG